MSNSLDREETIQLYITPNSFILVKREHILEIQFDGHKFTRKDKFEPKNIIQKHEIYGVLGFFEGFQEKYMVVITAVHLSGFLMGHAIYTIEKVICLSFDSAKACQKLNKADEEDEGEVIEINTKRSSTTVVQPTRSNSFLTRIKKTFAKNQIVVDTTVEEPDTLMIPSVSSPTSSRSSFEQNDMEEQDALEHRLVKQITEMFSKSMFIFSNTLDITHNYQAYSENDSTLLWKKVDKRFWWNEHFSRDFLTLNLDEWIVPVMQGTVHIEPCHVDGHHFDFVLISRRSRERAGMRYQRRGINEEGQVANFVETEQIVVFKKGETNHVASFVQTRGSIPLFWSQSPYSLHPIPSLERTNDENHTALKRHFAIQKDHYGKQTIVNLAELVGREAIVGSQYRKHVEEENNPNIEYIEFDFHKETKGMKFENINKLIQTLYNDISKMQYFWQTSDDANSETNTYCTQSGVFRTNCMDCLDRTNVVQSAIGRSVLNIQLMRFGISEYPEKGIKYYNEFERIFNNAWANNGDMISRMYAGTSALKGDFTRTGKRNITGMMNDASNSLARMYFNTIKDFWRQATVDFVLGYHKLEIFRHVPQSTKMSAEPGLERRWAKIRNDAIKVSSEIVINDQETKINGWTLLSPLEKQSGKSYKKQFEEKVVLLTEKALYVCSYNYDLEKVMQFKRLELNKILSIQMGEYILSTLTPASRSEEQNYGIILNYSKSGEDVRWNTGSIRNQNLGDLSIDQKESFIEEEEDGLTFTDSIYFKAVRYNVLGELDGQVETCKQQIYSLVKSIANACGHQENDPQFVVQKPIISLAQAEKIDTIFKKMEHKLKLAIWV